MLGQWTQDLARSLHFSMPKCPLWICCKFLPLKDSAGTMTQLPRSTNPFSTNISSRNDQYGFTFRSTSLTLSGQPFTTCWDNCCRTLSFAVSFSNSCILAGKILIRWWMFTFISGTSNSSNDERCDRVSAVTISLPRRYLMCGSRKYPYPPRKGFAVWPPLPSGFSKIFSHPLEILLSLIIEVNKEVVSFTRIPNFVSFMVFPVELPPKFTPPSPPEFPKCSHTPWKFCYL